MTWYSAHAWRFFLSVQKSAFCEMCCGNNRSTKAALLGGGSSHIHFHNGTSSSWFSAPGFTCQLWWIFSICPDRSELPGWGAGGPFKWQINHRIIYLRALSGEGRTPSIYVHATSTTNRHWRLRYEPSAAISPSAPNPPSYGTGRRDAFKRPREVSGCHKRQRFHGFEYQKAARPESFAVLILKV